MLYLFEMTEYSVVSGIIICLFSKTYFSQMLNKHDRLSCSLCPLNAKLFISALQNVKKEIK